MMSNDEQCVLHNIAYGREMANSLAAMGEIPVGQPVALVPFFVTGQLYAFRRAATLRRIAREVTVVVPRFFRGKGDMFEKAAMYVPHGKGPR